MDGMEKMYARTGINAEVALKAGEEKLTELKNQIPASQKDLDDAQLKVDQKRVAHAQKQIFIARMMQNMQELRQSQEKLQRAFSKEAKGRVKAKDDTVKGRSSHQKSKGLLQRFEHGVTDMLFELLQDTQAELHGRLHEMQELECIKEVAEEDFKRLQDEKSLLHSWIEALTQQKVATVAVKREVGYYCEAQSQQPKGCMNEMQSQQTHMIPSVEEEKGAESMEETCEDSMDETTEEERAVATVAVVVPRLACDRVQTPSPGPFTSNLLNWFSEEAYIPIARVKDFIQGEEKRPDFECRFTIRKTEDRYVSNGKKLIRYWCSYGPHDLRREAVQPAPFVDNSEAGGGGTGSRALGHRRKVRYSARGCRCHFAVIYLKERPEACLIRWLYREHRDMEGGVCHGRLEAPAAPPICADDNRSRCSSSVGSIDSSKV